MAALLGRERTSLCLFLVTIKFVLPCIIYIMQPDRHMTNNYNRNNKTNPSAPKKGTEILTRTSVIVEKTSKLIAVVILNLKM